MTIPEPQPRPPNTICGRCLENIIPDENTCSKNPNGKHMEWRGDNTGLRQEATNG